MIRAPGSFLWLLAHDMRNSRRRFMALFGTLSARSIMLLLIAGVIGLHLAAWPVVLAVTPLMQGEGGNASLALVALVACTASWMTAQSLFGATRALFDRGDLDLLLASPLPARRIFAAKAASIAMETFSSVAILTLPIVHVAAILDRPAWLGAYPALIGIALAATAIGVSTAIGLFFLVGPRRARTYAQLTGAAIGGAFVLAAQIAAMLPAPLQAALGEWLDGVGLAGSRLATGILWAPVEAFRGDARAILALLTVGTALFAGTVVALGARFCAASLAAVGAAAGGSTEAQRRPRTFRAGLGAAMRRKELLLIARDPNLLAQISLQIIYTVPVAVVLLRSETLPAAVALAPAIVVIAAQVAASLAWITVSGEDAPELIATAPVAQVTVDRMKLSAIVPPVLLIVALPLAALAAISWSAALVALVFTTLACISTALLNFWHPMPGNRRGMLRRHSQSKLIGLIEHTLAVLWAIATVFAMISSSITAVPVVLAVGCLAAFRWWHARPMAVDQSSGAAATQGRGGIALGVAG